MIHIAKKAKEYGINLLEKGDSIMPVHHGGKVGKAAKNLATKGTSKKTKSSAGKLLANHKNSKH